MLSTVYAVVIMLLLTMFASLTASVMGFDHIITLGAGLSVTIVLTFIFIIT